MANFQSIERSQWRVAALTGALVALALLSTAPASASIGIQRSEPKPTVVGAVDPKALHHFTLFLTSKASRDDVRKVEAYLEKYRVTAELVGSDRKSPQSATDNPALHVVGSFGDIEQAFGVSFYPVQMGSVVFTKAGPTHLPSLIKNLVVASSISPGPPMRAQFVKMRPGSQVGLGPQGYGPADFASIYNIPITLGGSLLNNGAGQTVAIAACTRIVSSDIAAYAALYGLPTPHVNLFQVDGTYTGPPDGEAELDVEMVASKAPAATIDLYVAPPNVQGAFCSTSEFTDMFAAIAAKEQNASSLSVSYGSTENDEILSGDLSNVLADSLALQEIAHHRVATFVSSGDSGSWGDTFASGFINFRDVNSPASDPSVIAVGGTTVEETELGERAFEYAWGGASPFAIGGGSGGGVSSFFAIPSWQAHVPGIASTLFRNVPDVAFDADIETPVLAVLNGQTFWVGGTSVGAPSWNGIWAIVNSNRAINFSHLRVSDPVTALYRLRGTPAFIDITKGTNGYYAAGPGYDNVTGLGVPNVATLLKYLQ